LKTRKALGWIGQMAPDPSKNDQARGGFFFFNFLIFSGPKEKNPYRPHVLQDSHDYLRLTLEPNGKKKV
jgi:hypothetical protein